MTKKAKARQKAQEEKRKQSEMLRDESAKEINKKYRNDTLWIKKKK